VSRGKISWPLLVTWSCAVSAAERFPCSGARSWKGGVTVTSLVWSCSLSDFKNFCWGLLWLFFGAEPRKLLPPCKMPLKMKNLSLERWYRGGSVTASTRLPSAYSWLSTAKCCWSTCPSAISWLISRFISEMCVVCWSGITWTNVRALETRNGLELTVFFLCAGCIDTCGWLSLWDGSCYHQSRHVYSCVSIGWSTAVLWIFTSTLKEHVENMYACVYVWVCLCLCVREYMWESTSVFVCPVVSMTFSPCVVFAYINTYRMYVWCIHTYINNETTTLGFRYQVRAEQVLGTSSPGIRARHGVDHILAEASSRLGLSQCWNLEVGIRQVNQLCICLHHIYICICKYVCVCIWVCKCVCLCMYIYTNRDFGWTCWRRIEKTHWTTRWTPKRTWTCGQVYT